MARYIFFLVFMVTAYTLQGVSSYREEVRKSRFVAHAAPVVGIDDAMSFIARYSDATASHNCWAYRIGNAYRLHDAGEPGGTAGRPILQAIEGQSCDRVVVLVTRWFGGILLGAGGLMRAYGGCAANCLRQGVLVPVVETVRAGFACTFAELPVVKSRLREYATDIVQEAFTAEGATLILTVPRERVGALSAMLSDLSRGRARLAVHDD